MARPLRRWVTRHDGDFDIQLRRSAGQIKIHSVGLCLLAFKSARHQERHPDGTQATSVATCLSKRSWGLVDEFYVPCLKRRAEEHRAAGYFTSRSLALVAAGLPAFIANEGCELLIGSESSVGAGRCRCDGAGYLERSQVIETALGRAIAVVPDDFATRASRLLGLVDLAEVDLRVAVRRGEPGPPRGTSACSSTVRTTPPSLGHRTRRLVSVSNFESIDVFRSWSEEATRVQLKREAFEGLWSIGRKGLSFRLRSRGRTT